LYNVYVYVEWPEYLLDSNYLLCIRMSCSRQTRSASRTEASPHLTEMGLEATKMVEFGKVSE
jgi:hypothetical protein